MLYEVITICRSILILSRSATRLQRCGNSFVSWDGSGLWGFRPGSPSTVVITSYSIHYTKLYEHIPRLWRSSIWLSLTASPRWPCKVPLSMKLNCWSKHLWTMGWPCCFWLCFHRCLQWSAWRFIWHRLARYFTARSGWGKMAGGLRCLSSGAWFS